MEKTYIKAEWSCHTPNLLEEILGNPGMSILDKPLNIFSKMLYQVAERASDIDDPILNILMLRLTLYEVADLEIYTCEERDAAFNSQYKRLEEQSN